MNSFFKFRSVQPPKSTALDNRKHSLPRSSNLDQKKKTLFITRLFSTYSSSGSDGETSFKTSSVQTVVLVQPVLVVGHLNVPPKGNITLAGIRLDAQMKNWKLDVRFSSALSQRGPWVWIKWKKGDDASSWNDDLCTRPVYVGNLRTLRNQNITNFTADWKLWHLRSQHTSRGDCFKTEKKKAATGKHPFLIIAPVMMRGWLHLCPLTCFEDKYPE